MIILSLNVRGLNSFRKVEGVKALVRLHMVDILILLETIVRNNNLVKIKRKFGSNWMWQHNYAHSSKGRIWLGWDTTKVKVGVSNLNEQVVNFDVEDRYSLHKLIINAVYGLHTIGDRKVLWESPRISHQSISIPWLIVSDFNTVFSAKHRVNRAEVTSAEFKDGSDCLEDLGLSMIKSSGHFFPRLRGRTWLKGNVVEEIMLLGLVSGSVNMERLLLSI